MKAHKKITRNVFIFLFDVKFKFFALAAALIYIVVLFWFVLKDFRSNDPYPQLNTIKVEDNTPSQILSTIVRPGLIIKNFSTFDLPHNNFVIDALVWFEFPKGELMIETIDKFSIDNGKIISKSQPHVSFNGNAMIVRYDVIFELKTNLSFLRFPLEDHRLSIIINNTQVTVDEMHFEEHAAHNTFKITPEAYSPNWKIQRLEAYTGYTKLYFDDNDKQSVIETPKAAFIINLGKEGINKALIIFVPLFAAVFFALFTFLMSFNSYQGKTNLALTAVTAILGYRFVIQQMSPAVSYFTLSDKIFLFFLFLSFGILLFQIILLRHYMFLMDREKVKVYERAEADVEFLVPKITERINTAAYFIAIILLIIGVTWIVL